MRLFGTSCVPIETCKNKDYRELLHMKPEEGMKDEILKGVRVNTLWGQVGIGQLRK